MGTHFLRKATIVYAHNPDLYEWIEPPIIKDKATLAQHERELVENEERMEHDIAEQKELVKEFVAFLQSLGITVAYDQLIDDCAVNNRRLWIQNHIKNSGYVIFIITPSFVPFIENDVTPEREMIFQGPYLHNLISNPGKNQVLVSVFLNRPRDCEQVPKALETGNIFELWTPFEQEERRKDDLFSFCNFILGKKK